jgi:hypothetical protein
MPGQPVGDRLRAHAKFRHHGCFIDEQIAAAVPKSDAA